MNSWRAEATTLADFYQERDVLSPKYYNDGLHIALATIAEIDVLVSWNFKHIVHFEKIRLFSAINMERGVPVLADLLATRGDQL